MVQKPKEKKQKNHVPVVEECVQSILPKWSDDLLKTLNKEDALPSLPKNVSARDVLYNFFRFYFDGSVENNTNVVDLLFATVTLIPVAHADMDLFPESYFSNVGQKTIFKIPDYKTPAELLNFTTGRLTSMRFPKRVDNPFLDQRFNKYKPADQEKFQLEVLQHLALPKPSIAIRRAAGFLAMTLLRFIIKSLNQMYSALSKTKFSETFKSMSQLKTYCNPCHDALKLLNRKIYVEKSDKANAKFGKMFTKIVSLYVELSTNHDSELHFLRAAILCHTEYFGMETMRFVDEAKALFRDSKIADSYPVNELVSMTTFPCTIACWDVIKNFEKEYSDKPKSLYWVRLIKLEYFQEIDAMNNFELCGMLSVLVNVYQGFNEKNDKTPKGVLFSNFMNKAYLLDYVDFHSETLMEQMYGKKELLSVFAQVPEHPMSREIVLSREFRTGNVVIAIEKLQAYKVENTVKKMWMHDWVDFKVMQMDSAIQFGRGLYFRLTRGAGIAQEEIRKIRRNRRRRY